MLTVLHCADIHLDPPFAALSPVQAAERREELRLNFARMLRRASDGGISLCLICGDLFDSDAVSADTVSFVCGLFADVAPMRIVILPGNHDPYTPNGVYGTTRFPENVFVFTSAALQCTPFPDLGADVYGSACAGENASGVRFSGAYPARRDRINILCAHGSLHASDAEFCPISVRDIEDSGFDYYALGHYHNTAGLVRLGQKWYGYAGCMQGRDFGETGEKGAVVAAMKKSGEGFFADWRLVPFCSHHYEICLVHLSGVTDADGVLSAVRSALSDAAYDGRTDVRIVLTGELPAGMRIPFAALRVQWEGQFHSLEIRDESHPSPESEALRRDPSLRGAFYAALAPELSADDPAVRDIAELALRYGLAALDGADPDFD